jgi:5-methylcytosine-specific restriction endonuclease McrA
MVGTDLVVDHITPMAQGGGKYDEFNLQTLCRACNSRKNIESEGGYGNPAA